MQESEVVAGQLQAAKSHFELVNKLMGEGNLDYEQPQKRLRNNFVPEVSIQSEDESHFTSVGRPSTTLEVDSLAGNQRSLKILDSN